MGDTGYININVVVVIITTTITTTNTPTTTAIAFPHIYPPIGLCFHMFMYQWV